MTKYQYKRPKAITMWDFSWLERRWPGAGYEDWEQALDELSLRGYDAVRIDAYPHLLAADPEGEWTLKPAWNQQMWGAPALVRINRVRENLLTFISLCRVRGIMVGLSTWFREDANNIRMSIKAPEELAHIWRVTLDAVAQAGLMDTILYVDLCNEYPMDCWIPFLKNDEEYQALEAEGLYDKEKSVPSTSHVAVRWMNRSLALLREAYPDLDYTFSQTGKYDAVDEQDVSALDLLEPHLWMASYLDYYERLGYNYERFDSKGYENMALYGEVLYRSNAAYWDDRLRAGITLLANWSRRTNRPLITTEGWGVVDYKDWPGLKWDWVKHLCEIGVEQAVSEGRWVAIATSNFCGPQFVGMWRDMDWHQRLTDLIKNGRLPVE